MCNIGDGEAPTLYNETKPKARKQHKCCECGATIEPGETYQRIEGMWEGDFRTFKTCSFCDATRDKADKEFRLKYGRIPLGQLWECVGPDYAAEDAV